jgi:hypothetical protein
MLIFPFARWKVGASADRQTIGERARAAQGVQKARTGSVGSVSFVLQALACSIEAG